jgi:hypothetical protein
VKIKVNNVGNLLNIDESIAMQRKEWWKIKKWISTSLFFSI